LRKVRKVLRESQEMRHEDVLPFVVPERGGAKGLPQCSMRRVIEIEEEERNSETTSAALTSHENNQLNYPKTETESNEVEDCRGPALNARN